MRDLSDPRWMKLKAVLFAGIGLLSAFLLWLESPRLITVVLLLLCIWAFCRLYYFAFYVIERYIDPTFKFSGLFAALRYLMSQRSKREE
jgi:hypothetical protein